MSPRTRREDDRRWGLWRRSWPNYARIARAGRKPSKMGPDPGVRAHLWSPPKGRPPPSRRAPPPSVLEVAAATPGRHRHPSGSPFESRRRAPSGRSIRIGTQLSSLPASRVVRTSAACFSQSIPLGAMKVPDDPQTMQLRCGLCFPGRGPTSLTRASPPCWAARPPSPSSPPACRPQGVCRHDRRLRKHEPPDRSCGRQRPRHARIGAAATASNGYALVSPPRRYQLDCFDIGTGYTPTWVSLPSRAH